MEFFFSQVETTDDLTSHSEFHRFKNHKLNLWVTWISNFLKKYIKLSVYVKSMSDETDSKSKTSDNNNKKKDILEIMKELQPVAFLLSICLVIAAFYANPVNEVAKTNLRYILMASLFFFFAYMGLFYYKKTDFTPFLYFGECSIIVGAFFVINAFSGIINIIDEKVNPIYGFFATVLFTSFFFNCICLFIGKSEKRKSI